MHVFADITWAVALLSIFASPPKSNYFEELWGPEYVTHWGRALRASQVNPLFLSFKVAENKEEGRLKRTERIEWKREVKSEEQKQEEEPEEGASRQLCSASQAFP